MDRSTSTFTRWRDRNPLRELILWLLLIWTPVFYIYTNNRNEVLLPDSSLPIYSPPDDKKGSTPDQSAIRESSKKQRDIANFPANASGPSVKSSMRNESSHNVIKKETLKDGQDHDSAGKEKSNNELDADSQPEADNDSKDKTNSAEVRSLPHEDEFYSPNRPSIGSENPYLAMVQRRISNEWSAPSISQPMKAVVRFRLEKTGLVSMIEIEESSGNEYFDLAAKRAVMSVCSLPSFPAEIDEEYLSAHLRFSNESAR